MYELLAFFGDYAEEYEEETHMAYAPCDNETFLFAYMAGHMTKFGEDFEIN